MHQRVPKMRALAAVYAIVTAVSASAALAQAPSEDALKQIIEEGSAAYFDWTVTLSDRDRITRLYQDNAYHLLWSNGGKPTAAAVSLVHELEHAGDRGLDPLDYPGNRLAELMTELIAAPQSGSEQWALFDADLSLASMQ